GEGTAVGAAFFIGELGTATSEAGGVEAMGRMGLIGRMGEAVLVAGIFSSAPPGRGVMRDSLLGMLSPANVPQPAGLTAGSGFGDESESGGEVDSGLAGSRKRQYLPK